MNIGTQLRMRRAELNISKREVSERCKLSESTVKKFEEDKGGSLKNLSKLCKALGQTYEVIFYNEEI